MAYMQHSNTIFGAIMIRTLIQIFIILTICNLCSVLMILIPHPFHVCKKYNVDRNGCLSQAIEFALGAIGSRGIPSIGLPSIDPLEIDELHIGKGMEVLDLEQNYYNIKLYGYSKAKISNAHYDVETRVLTFTSCNDVKQLAHYNLTGKVLTVPVVGEGDSILDLYGTKLVHTISFKEKIKNACKYFDVDSYTISMKIAGAHYHFSNLFNGDKCLAEQLLNSINEDPLNVFEDVRAVVESSYAWVFKTLAQRVFDKIPANELLPY